MILFRLDYQFRHHLAGNGPHFMHFSIPELQQGLSFKPSLAYQQTINDACSILFSASFFRGLYHVLGDHSTICSCDLCFIKLAWNDLFDLVL